MSGMAGATRTNDAKRPTRPGFPDVGKEVVGVVAGLGLFGCTLAMGIPLLFAAGAGAVAFAAGYALVPRRRTAAEVLLAPEVTQQMLNEFLQRGRAALARVRALEPRLQASPLAAKMGSLCDTLERILDNCERDPQDIRSARSLPFYVEKIEEYVSSYATLVEAGKGDPDVRRRLEATEAMIVRAATKFEEMHRAMLENDLRALEARAGALSMEFGEEDTSPAQTGSRS